MILGNLSRVSTGEDLRDKDLHKKIPHEGLSGEIGGNSYIPFKISVCFEKANKWRVIKGSKYLVTETYLREKVPN